MRNRSEVMWDLFAIKNEILAKGLGKLAEFYSGKLIDGSRFDQKLNL